MNENWNVLIADDDPEIVLALTICCRQLGMNVETAENGMDAICRAAIVAPHLLIVDIGMPEADGYEVCNQLLKKNIVCPVIFLTGRSDEEAIQRCEALGGHYVLKNSFSWDKLRPLIDQLLWSYWPHGPKPSRFAVT